MAKFQAVIGFIRTEETAPGVHSEVATEVIYRGDVLREVKNWENSGSINDNLTINNRFSIIGNPYAFQNLQHMRYIKWMGSLWKITSVEVQRPRLILTVGGIYNAS